MNAKVENIVVGKWQRDATLGSGAFGVITLWRNIESGERIALKQCKWTVTGNADVKEIDLMNAITPKHRERWKQEVQIMHKLDHPNVIKAIKVPSVLDVPSSFDLPSLGMEYCSGGDLRRVLNKPENCCGLEEKAVRSILSQIASAVLYLHSNRIIHRDLKPENIVIQIKSNGDLVYKLIDLGYCKQLDQSSLCNSFVGTLQYLAPELFISKQYTSAVDNWSFGLLAHEIITGKRPFLPHLSPTQWIPIVSRKKSEDICAVHDTKLGKVTFSKEISSFNHISKSLKENIEIWLRTVFEWDPSKRGGKEAFVQLENILSKVIVDVFILNSLEYFSYEVNRETQFNEFQILIESNSKIAPKDQFIVFQAVNNSNEALIFSTNVKEDFFRSFCEQCHESKQFAAKAYLLDRSKPLVYASYLSSRIIPSSVEQVLLNPTQLVTFEEQKSCWKYLIWSSQKIVQQFISLVQVYNLIVNHNANLVDYVLRKFNNSNIRCHQVSAINEFFKTKLNIDLNMISKNEALTKSDKMNNLLSTCEEIFTTFKSQQWLDSKLKIYSHSLTELFTEQKDLINQNRKEFDFNPLSPRNISDSINKDSYQMIETYLKMLQVFDEMRRKPKEERVKHVKSVGNEAAFDNTAIVRLLCDIFQVLEKLMKQAFAEISKLVEFTDSCQKMELDINSLSKYLLQIQSLKDLQAKYQTCIWDLLSASEFDSNSKMNCDRNDVNISTKFKRMDELLSKIIAEVSSSKESQVCDACYAAKEILGDKSTLLKCPASEIRVKCLSVIKYALESKSSKLKVLAVNGCQHMLRDDLYWICDTLDEHQLLPLQMCAVIESTILTQSESIQIDLLKILMEMIWCPLQIKLLSSGISKIKCASNQESIIESAGNHGFGRGSESVQSKCNDKISALKEMFSIAQELIRLFGTKVSMRPVLEALFHRIFMDSVKECSLSDDKHIVNQSVLCVVMFLQTLDKIVRGEGLETELINAIKEWSLNQSNTFSEYFDETGCDNTSRKREDSTKLTNSGHLMRKDFKDFEITSYKNKLGEILDDSSSLSSSSSTCSLSGENVDEYVSCKHSRSSETRESTETELGDFKDSTTVNEEFNKESETLIEKLKLINVADDSSVGHTWLEGCKDNKNMIDRLDRENARHFYYTFKSHLHDIVLLRTAVEVDCTLQKFASQFSNDLWESQSEIIASKAKKTIVKSEQHYIIINSDGLYLAMYSGLVLSLKLQNIHYYDDPNNIDVPISEQEFVNEVQKSGVLIYISATWLREFYQMILKNNIFEDFPEQMRKENLPLLNLIKDIGGQNDRSKGAYELSDFKKITHSTSLHSLNTSSELESSKVIVKLLITKFWSSISTILSSLFMNDSEMNTTQSLLTLLLSDFQKEYLEKRETLIQCLEALQTTARICILLGLQSKCNGIFDMLTKSITNPYIDGNNKKKGFYTEIGFTPCLHSSQVLSLQAIMTSALEVASHCHPCWDFVFTCCSYVLNLEYLHFSKQNTTKESKFNFVLKLKKEKPSELEFPELQPVITLLGPHTEAEISECLNECIKDSSKSNASHETLLHDKNFERAVECLAYLAEKVFTDAASRLNLESLIGFLQSLINNSSRELNSRTKSNSLTKAPLLFHKFCDVMLKITKSGRPLIHMMKCWSIAYPHFVEAACQKMDSFVCKTAISTINDIITSTLSSYTELPFFHFNEALFKPYETLLLLEMCESDIQEMIISSICGFVEGFAEELRSGWRSLFGALRGIRLPNIPYGNNAVDAYELEMERVRQLRVILDIFEAFLDKKHLDIFANAAVDCLLCLLQLLKDPLSEEMSNHVTEVANYDNNDSVDLCLLALKYLHQFESMLRSMYKMPACPMFSCNRSITTCSEPKTIDMPAFCEKELHLNVPSLLSDIDRAVKILHVWYLLLDGLTNSITTCPLQHQTKTMEMSLSLLGTLRQNPGQEFATYCINHIALPLLQRWSRSLVIELELNSNVHLNNFKHFCGLLSHLVIEHLKVAKENENDIGFDLMLTQTLVVFIEMSDGAKPRPMVNLSLACIRHVVLESFQFWTKSMFTTLLSMFKIGTKIHLYNLNEIIDAFSNRTIHFYDDLSAIKIVTKRQNTHPFEEPEMIVRGYVQQVFLLDSQRSFSNITKRGDSDNRCFMLQIERDNIEHFEISFTRLVRDLFSHQTLLITLAEILLYGLPHTLPNVSNLMSKLKGKSPFILNLDRNTINQFLEVFSNAGHIYREFDNRPGLKFLIQKICDISVPANLYQQSALCFSVKFLIYFFFCIENSDSCEYELKLQQLFERTCEEYTDFIIQTQQTDSRLDELSQQPIFFMPQIVELNEILGEKKLNNSEENCETLNEDDNDIRIYKIVDQNQIKKMTNEYKKWKSQHCPIPPSFSEKIERKKSLPKRFYCEKSISAVEKANQISLMKDSEAYLCLWTQILQSILELHLALSQDLFEKFVPIFESGFESLVMYAMSKDLKSLLTLWIRRVAFRE
ncbi:brefeldin A-inhibited guanine nucleotide-exchange protein 3-like protein [Dinothrombium tinctorium]|uniref:IkappaB kinase n=1 Tax=Dinothrombium tinctorium TaxID=1965070 RepID=A0A3S3SNN3_9ACAR|nr:brefeldin A-inhibited guanine nucleotide-exchange protein 3-like protein [Dinothrombium tinctorium]